MTFYAPLALGFGLGVLFLACLSVPVVLTGLWLLSRAAKRLSLAIDRGGIHVTIDGNAGE